MVGRSYNAASKAMRLDLRLRNDEGVLYDVKLLHDLQGRDQGVQKTHARQTCLVEAGADHDVFSKYSGYVITADN